MAICEVAIGRAVHTLDDELPHQALAKLLPDQRVALMFRYLDQMSVREVAKLMHRSESATESLLSRAREAFRLAYEGQTDA